MGKEESELNAKISALLTEVTYIAKCHAVASERAFVFKVKCLWYLFPIPLVTLIHVLLRPPLVAVIGSEVFMMTVYFSFWSLRGIANSWHETRLFHKWRAVENKIREWRCHWNLNRITTEYARMKLARAEQIVSELKSVWGYHLDGKSYDIAKAKLSREFPEAEVTICKSYGYDENLLASWILEEARAQKSK